MDLILCFGNIVLCILKDCTINTISTASLSVSVIGKIIIRHFDWLDSPFCGCGWKGDALQFNCEPHLLFLATCNLIASCTQSISCFQLNWSSASIAHSTFVKLESFED